MVVVVEWGVMMVDATVAVAVVVVGVLVAVVVVVVGVLVVIAEMDGAVKPGVSPSMRAPLASSAPGSLGLLAPEAQLACTTSFWLTALLPLLSLST